MEIKYARNEGKKEGIREGIEKGKKEGEKKKAIEIAKKSLSKGLDVETISDLTGLTIEEIRKLTP